MTHRIRQLGMSLIELMVAMAIGLVVMLVVFQLFSVSETARRTSVAGSDAQMSAAIAVTAVQDQVRNAGYGLVDRFRDAANTAYPILGCTVVGVDVRGGGAGVPISFPMAPVVITPGAAAMLPDSITITYGDLPFPSVPTNLMQNMGSPTDAQILVNNRYGIRPGDVLVLAQNNPPGGVSCWLAESTGTPNCAAPCATPATNSTVQRGTGSYLDTSGNTTTVRYNGAGGPAPLAYSTNGAVYNFGRGPSRVQFALLDASVPADGVFDQLTVTNFLGAGTGAPTAQPLVEGIVAFKAQYGVGVDTTVPADGLADVFSPATAAVNQGAAAGTSAWQLPASAANPCPPAAGATLATCQWGLVVAVRFAVLARSGLMERKDPVSNLCTATAANSPELTWAGGTFDVSNIPDWQCYRYKKFEAVVPLRNLIWMPT
jgi:type IV pilus assembly protein PilW